MTAIDRALRPHFLAVLSLVISLGACALPPAGDMKATETAKAPAPSGVEPRFKEQHFVAADGVELPLRIWLPQGRIKAIVLAVHGFNDYSNSFSGPATE